jgi:DNA replication and repair protein RecF
MQKTSLAVAKVESRGLAITRVSLSNFRNYNTLRLDLNQATPSPIVLFGDNGAGKTNLLEALSYLSAGRGLRGAKLSEVSSIQSNRPWAVAAHINGKLGQVDIGTGLGKTVAGYFCETGDGRDKRVVRIDGVNLSGPAGLSDHVSIVWLTPKMDRLFVEGASARRKFFDQMTSSFNTNHSKQLSSYERAMRERVRILTYPNLEKDPSWIGALERKMAEHGVAVAAMRLEVLAQLSSHIQMVEDSPFPRAAISLEGLLEKGLKEKSALDVEESFREKLKYLRQEDSLTGRTKIGPHKTDMVVYHKEKEMPANFCSTGEQKALLIGIVLAHGKVIKNIQGSAPIFLMDEVAAHLDEDRRILLFKELIDLGSQTWLSGTDRKLFGFLKNKSEMFEVSAANLSRV